MGLFSYTNSQDVLSVLCNLQVPLISLNQGEGPSPESAPPTMDTARIETLESLEPDQKYM